MRTLAQIIYHARLYTSHMATPPTDGDLVVEITHPIIDEDGIGYLVGHGPAPLHSDRSGEIREVWDIIPLSMRHGVDGLPYQRWENAEFRRVTVSVPWWRRVRARRRWGKVTAQLREEERALELDAIARYETGRIERWDSSVRWLSLSEAEQKVYRQAAAHDRAGVAQ
jgi:hypothetical protein